MSASPLSLQHGPARFPQPLVLVEGPRLLQSLHDLPPQCILMIRVQALGINDQGAAQVVQKGTGHP